jgi:PAS domain S-box-containing protein
MAARRFTFPFQNKTEASRNAEIVNIKNILSVEDEPGEPYALATLTRKDRESPNQESGAETKPRAEYPTRLGRGQAWGEHPIAPRSFSDYGFFSNSKLKRALKMESQQSPAEDPSREVSYHEGVKKKIEGGHVCRNDTQTVPAEALHAQALQASELRYRRLFEAARDGILILDADTGRIIDANPFLADLLDFSHSEMIGKTVGELSPFKDIESNKVMLERLQEDMYVRYDNLPLERRDGRKIAVEFVSNVYQAGEKIVIQCNIRDITERTQTEQRLKASTKEISDLKLALQEQLASLRLAAIVESSEDAIIGKDLNGLVTSWNKGAEKIFGHPASEMIGHSVQRLIPADRRDEEDQILKKIKHGENVELFETLRQTKDGRLIDVSLTLSAIKDATGRVVGVSKVARDITDRKAAEIIRQNNISLEQSVLERTAQLQMANEELQAFSYSVSHDLRAPLRHIMGFVALLQKDAGPALSEASLGRLTTISQAAQRMGCLIDDLLAFSHVGRAELQKSDFELDGLVLQTLGDFQAETKERNIAWEIHPLPLVRADRALLRMVLVNLISNAVKFTSRRAQPKIEIGCAPGGAAENVIFIRDNGAGFDACYAEKLFGVFQRLHSQAAFEGTGIGLANVQRIIKRHGGRVWAEGVVDGGATFYFSIPKQTKA